MLKIIKGEVVPSSRTDEFGPRAGGNDWRSNETSTMHVLHASGFKTPGFPLKYRLSEKNLPEFVGVMYHHYRRCKVFFDIRNPRVIIDVVAVSASVGQQLGKLAPVPTNADLMPVVMRAAGYPHEHLSNPISTDVVDSVIADLGYERDTSYEPVKPEFFGLKIEAFDRTIEAAIGIKTSTGEVTDVNILVDNGQYLEFPPIVSRTELAAVHIAEVLENMGWREERATAMHSMCNQEYTAIVMRTAFRVMVNDRNGTYRLDEIIDTDQPVAFTIPRWEGQRPGEVAPLSVMIPKALARDVPHGPAMVEKDAPSPIDFLAPTEMTEYEQQFIGCVDWNAMSVEQRSIYLLGVHHGQKTRK